MKIAHVSDIHGDGEGLRAIVASILAREDLAQLALAITGDVTDDGQPHEWRGVQQALAPLTGLIPIWMVPGNHDCGMSGITYDEERAQRSRHAIDMISTTPIIASPTGLRVWRWGVNRIIGLDSQRGQAGEILPPLARGEIGKAQIAALEVELADPSPTVVLLHHHPLWDEALHVLEDAAALKALIERRPQVKAVLFGHQHKEALWGTPKTRLWVSSGKSTDQLAYRLLDLETMRLTRCVL